VREINLKQNKADGNRVTWKVPEAARVAGCGDRAIRNGIANGTIPHVKFGRNIVIPRVAFLRWLEACGELDTASEALREIQCRLKNY
jgi:excisionase family DNA binding protein